MKKYFSLIVVLILLFSIFSCSKKATDPEPPHRWYPTDPAQGGDSLDFQVILGTFPVDMPNIPFPIPLSGNITTMIAKIMKNNSPISGVHVLIKGSLGDSVFLKEFSDLDHLYFPTMALPLYPPEYDYPLSSGSNYSVKVTTDLGSASGTVLMPYIGLTYPGTGDTVINLASVGDTLWLRWTTNGINVAAAVLQITGDFAFGPIPIPVPDVITTLPIPTAFLSTGNVTFYFSAVNMDTIQGSILRYDTIPTFIGDTLIGNYCFPTALYTVKRQIRFE